MSHPELSRYQQIMLFLFGRVKTRTRKKQGWGGHIQFYAFKCPEHGVVEDYPHGYREILRCPYCIAD